MQMLQQARAKAPRMQPPMALCTMQARSHGDLDSEMIGGIEIKTRPTSTCGADSTVMLRKALAAAASPMLDEIKAPPADAWFAVANVITTVILTDAGSMVTATADGLTLARVAILVAIIALPA